MQLRLSPSAQRLLVRGFFFVLAFGSFYGIYDNREFFLRFPFYVTAFIDLAFGIVFLYSAIMLHSLLRQHKKAVLALVGAFLLYIVGSGIIGTIAFLYTAGLEEAVAMSGYNTPLYITSEVLYVLVFPTLVLGIIFWILRGKKITS